MKGIVKRYFIVYFSIAIILVLVNECLNSKYRLNAESLLLLLSITAGVVVAFLLVMAIRKN